MTTTKTIEFDRINNDVNGNPRYVCHYLNLLTDAELGYHDGTQYHEGTLPIFERYGAAVARAKKIGGKKYRAKSYGGGIVFQSYNIQATEARIFELLKTGK